MFDMQKNRVFIPFTSYHEVIAEKKQRGTIPSVTVAISLYNYEQYIIECLESVKSQTISNLGLVIVDDCSLDSSLQLARNWLSKHGDRFNNYMLVRHTFNGGLSSARNTAFAMARTKYVFVLDADNLLYPQCLETLSFILDDSDASFAYCYLEKFETASGLMNTHPWNAATLQHGNTIDAMVLLRKNVWEEVGGYSTNKIMRLGWEDFELWFKIARIRGRGIQVKQILAKYRVHPDSMVHTITNPNSGLLWAYLRSNYPEFFL